MSSVAVITSVIAAGAGITLGQVTAYFSSKQKAARKRTAELEHVAFALEQHFVELDNFMSDAAAPDVLKFLLLSFSDAIASRETACNFVKQYARNDVRSTSPITQEILREIDTLRAHRPDLVESFERALGLGFVAMLLRWKETAEMYSLTASQIVSDRYKEIDFAATMIKPGVGRREMPEFAGASV